MVSPDPEINRDAKDYFTRHMRILEKCSTAWPQQDMQKQINALREAFSVDTSRPFEMKPGLLATSPSPPAMQPSPPLDTRYQIPTLTRKTSPHNIPQPVQFQAGPMTPPMTADLEAPTSDSLGGFSGGMLSNGQQATVNTTQIPWNPAPIFE